MGKKKAIKLATATAIAASAFVAVAPTQSEAATSSVDKAITKATNQMAKAYDTYHKAAKNEGKLPATGTIRNQVKLANDYYTAATKEIAKNGGSKTQKAAYTKKLEAKKYFLDRAEAYLAAVNTNLNPAKTAFNEAVAGGKQKTVLATQTAYNKAIKGFEAKVDKIYGPDARNLLKSKYAAPAHKLADSVNDEMTVYNAYKQIESEKLIEKDLKKAGVVIESVKAEVEKLKAKDTKLAKNILVAVEKNNKAYEAALDPEVKAVSAINASTLQVTGSNLNKITAADVTVADNSVKSFTASADGKSATVVLNDQIVPDVTTKVTVKDASFDVTYKVAATKATVNEATYDDDIANQFVAIQIDGKSVTAQELINAGYSVSFEAFDTKAATNNINTKLFGASTSSTGELATDLATEFSIPTSGLDIYVKVTLTKGSDVITSPLAKVTIKNIDLAANSIPAATLLNSGTTLNQASSTLVTGETAQFTDITVKAGAEEEEVTTGYSVKSSNDAVVSVNSTGVLTAEGPGTATVTVTYGNATYTKTFTVTNTARKATKIDAGKTAVTLTASNTSTASTTVKLLDQYGDAMVITSGTNVVLEESNTTVAGATLSSSAATTGVSTLTFTGKGAGAGTNTVTFRDAANVKIGTTAVRATVTDNDSLAKYSLTLDSSISATDVSAVNTLIGGGAAYTASDISTDATLDLQSDKLVKLNLAGVNSAGVGVSNPQVDGTASEYTVTVNQSSAGVLAATPTYSGDGFVVVEAGTQTGTATITVTNAATNTIVATYKVTVTSVGYNVTNATLKNVAAPTYATTLNYEDFLSYKKAANDPVVTGITLTKDSAQPIRLALTAQTGAIGDLYIDKNADGLYDATDVKVGSTTISTTGTIAAAPATDVVAGVAVASGDNGTVLFKVLDNNNGVVATKSVKVDF